MPLSLDIVTPERVVLSEDGFDIVVAPGIEGELGLLPRHAPLMTMLEIGELRARRGAEEMHLAIAGGFLEIRDNRVTILADAAERSEEIDIARAEAARRRAEEAMANPPRRAGRGDGAGRGTQGRSTGAGGSASSSARSGRCCRSRRRRLRMTLVSLAGIPRGTQTAPLPLRRPAASLTFPCAASLAFVMLRPR